MRHWVVIEHTGYEGSNLFGAFGTFEDARAYIEECKARATEARDQGDRSDYYEWLYTWPNIEEWEGGKRLATWENRGLPTWENEATEETR